MMHALPGMGADHRMFPEPWSQLPDFIAHDWPGYSGEITLGDVALALCDKYAIRDGDSLIGASLGGMVACEITKIRKIETLYLIGSAINKQEVNSLLIALSSLAEITPVEWLKFSAGKIPSDLMQMFAEADAAFVRTMCRAIATWDGLPAPNTRLYRIHGRYDFVIPLPHAVDLVLNGGHLITMTHAQECVAFIRTYEARQHVTA
jgi:pimeloyl-ACP methyl ester carboxylesterase